MLLFFPFFSSSSFSFFSQRPPYASQPRLGDVSLIICLDSGCGNYDQLWLTTSLRGVCNVTVQGNASFLLFFPPLFISHMWSQVSVLKNGVHSGAASGVIPSSFRGIRNILDVLEDPKTGKVLLPELWVDIPPHRVTEAHKAADFLGPHFFDEYPLLPGVKLMHTELPELMLNRTWRPTLSYTGIDGIPSLATAGNVLRAQTTMVLSFRLPPTLPPKVAEEAIHKAITSAPVDGVLHVDSRQAAPGWNAPKQDDWLTECLENASQACWGKPAAYMGEGGSIPFMGLLHQMWPSAQFVITGVLGPGSNAHGPDEFLEISMAKRITATVAHIIAVKGKRQ